MGADNSVKCYRQLDVWQLGMDVAEQLYRSTASFPQHEMYGLRSQLRRAAVSIPSNIAEGHARDSTREYLHHVSIALGSTAEAETQLMLAGRLEYITQSVLADLLQHIDRLGKMLGGLQRALKAKL